MLIDSHLLALCLHLYLLTSVGGFWLLLYDAVIADLTAWYPKVRKGGLLSGDDYGDAEETPFMTTSRYVKGITGEIGWIDSPARQ